MIVLFLHEHFLLTVDDLTSKDSFLLNVIDEGAEKRSDGFILFDGPGLYFAQSKHLEDFEEGVICLLEHFIL